jgi:hypothetical protein
MNDSSIYKVYMIEVRMYRIWHKDSKSRQILSSRQLISKKWKLAYFLKW